VCGAAVRSVSPTAAVPTVVSDAHLNPLEKLHREIARRREVSLQRDSVRTATPKPDPLDLPSVDANSQPSNVVPIAEDSSFKEKGAPSSPAPVTMRLRKTKDCGSHPCRRKVVQITKNPRLTHDLFRQSGDVAP
jgi:hypothetical protein